MAWEIASSLDVRRARFGIGGGSMVPEAYDSRPLTWDLVLLTLLTDYEVYTDAEKSGGPAWLLFVLWMEVTVRSY